MCCSTCMIFVKLTICISALNNTLSQDGLELLIIKPSYLFNFTGKVSTKGELEKLFGEYGLPPPKPSQGKKKGETGIYCSLVAMKTNTSCSLSYLPCRRKTKNVFCFGKKKVSNFQFNSLVCNLFQFFYIYTFIHLDNGKH